MNSARWVLWALAAYVLVVAAVLLAPVSYSEIVIAVWSWLGDAFGLVGFGSGWVEFVANIVMFLPLGLLLTLLLRRAWVGFALAVSLSICAELVQLIIPGRLASPRDVLANALGAAIGGIGAWIVMVIRHRRSARRRATTRAR